RVAANEAFFQRDRRREAVAERHRIRGKQRAGSAGHRGSARVRAAVAERTTEEVEVGLRLAEGESGELNEAALGVDLALSGFTCRRLEAGAAVGAQSSVLG